MIIIHRDSKCHAELLEIFFIMLQLLLFLTEKVHKYVSGNVSNYYTYLCKIYVSATYKALYKNLPRFIGMGEQVCSEEMTRSINCISGKYLMEMLK